MHRYYTFKYPPCPAAARHPARGGFGLLVEQYGMDVLALLRDFAREVRSADSCACGVHLVVLGARSHRRQ